MALHFMNSEIGVVEGSIAQSKAEFKSRSDVFLSASTKQSAGIDLRHKIAHSIEVAVIDQ